MGGVGGGIREDSPYPEILHHPWKAPQPPKSGVSNDNYIGGSTITNSVLDNRRSRRDNYADSKSEAFVLSIFQLTV
jgi:hypothetical protein